MQEPAAMRPDDVVVLLGTVPERVADLVSGLDEPRLRYRHAPAFPTLKEVVAHLCEAGSAADVLLRHAYLDNETDLRVRGSIDPPVEPDVTAAVDDVLQGYARVRRRTVDLLRGMGDHDWNRRVTDPEQGEMSLLDVCSQIASHELGHVSQIRNLIALLPEP